LQLKSKIAIQPNIGFVLATIEQLDWLRRDSNTADFQAGRLPPNNFQYGGRNQGTWELGHCLGKTKGDMRCARKHAATNFQNRTLPFDALCFAKGVARLDAEYLHWVAQLRFRFKMRRWKRGLGRLLGANAARCEQMFFGPHLLADIEHRCRHVRFVPED
jgi:hypothetical protein